MDSDIEDVVKQCQTCQEFTPSPPPAPLHPWEWPSKPWSRLHLDFTEPILGQNFLVLVDACTKWMDVQLMISITTAKMIEKLSMIFSTHGLPLKIVVDNSASFTSTEFRQFMEWNGLCTVPSVLASSPGHRRQPGTVEPRLSRPLINRTLD